MSVVGQKRRSSAPLQTSGLPSEPTCSDTASTVAMGHTRTRASGDNPVHHLVRTDEYFRPACMLIESRKLVRWRKSFGWAEGGQYLLIYGR